MAPDDRKWRALNPGITSSTNLLSADAIHLSFWIYRREAGRYFRCTETPSGASITC